MHLPLYWKIAFPTDVKNVYVVITAAELSLHKFCKTHHGFVQKQMPSQKNCRTLKQGHSRERKMFMTIKMITPNMQNTLM